MNKEECTCTENVKALFCQAKESYLGIDESGENPTWWVYAAFTDKLTLNLWTPDCKRQEKIVKRAELLLELRLFSTVAEFRLIRGNIGEDFMFRVRDTDGDLIKNVDYYDEKQYLDVDTNMSKQNSNHWKVKTTGGGKYTIPLPDINDAGIWIRNYLSYYEGTGQAYVSDWRMLKLGRIK